MLDFIFRKSTGIFLFTLVLILFGLIIVSRLPVMMYPQTRRPQVQIDLRHSGISAVDFQDQYADQIEPRLLSLKNLEMIETTYSTDSSRFNLTFDWNIESDDARIAVENIMVTINSSLPDEIQDSYSVRYREGENAGYLVLGLTSESTASEGLYQILKTNLEAKLNQLQDVEEIGFYNTRRLLVDVTLDQKKMLSYGITINDVNTAFQAGFLPQPLGSLRTADGRLSLRLEKNGRTLESLPRLEVKKVGDSSITLDDIAVLNIRYTLPNRVFLVDETPAVQLTATPVEGGNINAMTAEIQKIMENARLEGLIPVDTRFALYLDPAKYIQKSIDNVIQAALIGGFLAILIIFLILGEWKNTLLIAASLPITIILNFLFMGLFGVSINLISLGGLALAVGMIVDSTIVVMENIHRHRKESEDEGKTLPWKTVVIDSVAQVRSPVIASTLTSILVFLPISFTAPLTNAILGDQARTVVFCLLVSLVVSLTIVPLVSFYLFRSSSEIRKAPGTLQVFIENMVSKLVRMYKNSLQWLLHRKIRALFFLISAFGGLIVCILSVMPLIPKEIISTPTSDRIVFFFRNNNITDPEELMNEILPEMNKRIVEVLGDRLVQKYTNLSGRFNQTFLDLRSSKDTEEAMLILQQEFVSEGDWYYSVLAWDPAALPLPMSFDFQLSLYGPDPEIKVNLLISIQELLNQEKLYQRTFTRPSSSVIEQLNLKPRQETIGKLPPWNESSLSSLIRRILSGTSSITLSDGLDDVQVSVDYPEEDLDSREELEDFLIPWNQNLVPLKHFFDFSTSKGVSQIYSQNGESAFQLLGFAGFRISDAERLKIQKNTEIYLNEVLVLPEGYNYSFDNPRIEMDKSIESLFIALAISIVLIYILLAFQFNSFWIPIIILVTIPLGFIGVILSLWVFKSTLNLNSLLGTILLGGIVVNNAIIMIDFYLKSRHEYPNYKEALVSTAAVRFKPILITTLTTIFGMLPLAIGLGEGSNILKPLGIAVSGGLLVSTIFTIYAVPSIMVLTHSATVAGDHEGKGVNF
ncbi:MAG: efflux RND transporter permease subunit [Spirochaetaceae bacterium]|jgi:HAE1 family hydrophobic/amphiphilic exporter-1|nr:efflux RND transporter permease subunit [Spirochaetaceae bacterium]